MARKKQQEEAPQGAPAWMATFSDLMNLLLCFFVLLFSMSSVDAEKYDQVVNSFANTFSIFSGGASSIGEGKLISNGASQLNELAEYYSDMGNPQESDETTENKLKDELKKEKEEKAKEMYEKMAGLAEKNHIEDSVAIDIDKDFQYVKISLSGAILFDSGKADIKKDAIPILDKVGDILKIYNKKDYVIKVEGHTDNIPINNRKYSDNMELSAGRSYSVWRFLTDKKGLNPKTLETSGKGEHNPVTSNGTADGRSKNRRVEIKIYNELGE